MLYHAGLDVSLEQTSLCVICEDGAIFREARIASDPEALAAFLKGLGVRWGRIGLEAGPLAPWLYRGLCECGLPAICIETRRMKAFSRAAPVKTDRKDAQLIAQAMRVGLYRAVHVKTDGSQKGRMLLTHRRALLGAIRRLENTIRGTLKAFGLRIGHAGARGFEQRVRELVADDEAMVAATDPMLVARAGLLGQFSRLDGLLRSLASRDAVSRRLMTVPGVGAITALAYRCAVDLPGRFSKSSSVAAHFGLTPRKYASGETDRTGHISRCGDGAVRSLLFEAAMVLLTRTKRWSSIKRWGVEVAKRRGLKRACIAVARKLAIMLHRIWVTGTVFQWGGQEA